MLISWRALRTCLEFSGGTYLSVAPQYIRTTRLNRLDFNHTRKSYRLTGSISFLVTSLLFFPTDPRTQICVVLCFVARLIIPQALYHHQLLLAFTIALLIGTSDITSLLINEKENN